MKIEKKGKPKKQQLIVSQNSKIKLKINNSYINMHIFPNRLHLFLKKF